MSTIKPIIDDNDANIAELARLATRQACMRALAAGRSVTVAEGDAVYRIDPDGTRTKVMDLKPEITLKARKPAIAG